MRRSLQKVWRNRRGVVFLAAGLGAAMGGLAWMWWRHYDPAHYNANGDVLLLFFMWVTLMEGVAFFSLCEDYHMFRRCVQAQDTTDFYRRLPLP